MLLDLDVTSRKVVVLGSAHGARPAVTRFVGAGAHVTLVSTGGLPPWRLDTVRHVDAPAADDTSGLLRLLGPAWLVVYVDPPAPLRARVAELTGHLRVMTTTDRSDAPSGTPDLDDLPVWAAP